MDYAVVMNDLKTSVASHYESLFLILQKSV